MRTLLPRLHSRCSTCSTIPDHRLLYSALITPTPSAASPHGRCAIRHFHDYFVTNLPSSSLHPDARSSAGPRHGLPRDKSTPHVPGATNRTPAAMVGVSRDMTVVRIPLRSAKHHFGVSVSRGERPYNEDRHQAGTIDIPAFAKRRPISLTRTSKGARESESTGAGTASGDPQVFYFGVFDGHGGQECSEFLSEQLHQYLEDSAQQFELESSLKDKDKDPSTMGTSMGEGPVQPQNSDSAQAGKEALNAVKMEKADRVGGTGQGSKNTKEVSPPESAQPLDPAPNKRKAKELEDGLVNAWKELVGGYFRRFKPEYFSIPAGQGFALEEETRAKEAQRTGHRRKGGDAVRIETVLTYAFLKADYDFVSAQASKKDGDPVVADRALNDQDVLENPGRTGKRIGGPKRFKGGSTCSIALISTPTPTPFWHPASPSTLVTSHVGDTRILLCNTATGLAIPMTTNHHPSHPIEAARLRRYAATFVTDSFGEERVSGLANTRAFGDMASKRIGVSAEPEIRRLELSPAEYSFIVLVSDGISGPLSDQEIVDIVKEARTPEQAARDVVSFATEIAADADNATALVIRLGGWERRSEGGVGSLGTKEMRDYKRRDAMDPRTRRQ